MAHDNTDSVPEPGSHPDDSQVIELEPSTTSQGCVALPPETLYHIFRLIGPQDLIRLQAVRSMSPQWYTIPESRFFIQRCHVQVSKLFRAIIRDIAIWRTVYSTTRLPLPPGPFPWQSIHFLQRALVHSARIAHVWTAEPLTRISKKVFTGPRSIEDDRFKWVRGRWLIVSKNMKQLRSRDVETDSEQLLWDHGSFAYWAAASVMNPLGHFIYVAVHLGKGHLEDPVYVSCRHVGCMGLTMYFLHRKLLEFVVDDDTGHLSGPEMFDVPTWSLPREAFTPRIRVESGIAPYAYISLCSASKPRRSLVFDPRDRRFYKFPRFRTQLVESLHYMSTSRTSLIFFHARISS